MTIYKDIFNQLELFDEDAIDYLMERPQKKRIIAHIDMDAFFASVELLYYPQLNNMPVVVGGSRAILTDDISISAKEPISSFLRLKDYSGRGVITTANYKARQYGIGSAMGLMRAAQLCPDAILLPSHFHLYQEYSKKFKDIILSYTPRMENRGIDEVYVDFSDINNIDADYGYTLAQNIQNDIFQATKLTCSIGIAPNKLIAKMASEFNKPNGIAQIYPDDFFRKIIDLSCSKINGIGPKTTLKLQKMGIHSIRDLYHYSLSYLQQEFGQSYGVWLYQVARGIDHSEVKTVRETHSVSREQTFPRDLNINQNKNELTKVLNGLCQTVSSDLKRKSLLGKTISIKVKFADFSVMTRVHSIDEYTQNVKIIRQAINHCLKKITFSQDIRLLGVKVENLLKIDTSASC